VVLLAIGCGTVHTAGSPLPAAPVASLSGVFSEVPGDDPALTQAGGSLYVRWDMPPAGAGMPAMVLARVDARTGAIAARNTFSPGLVAAPVYADGSLWVTDSTSYGELLFRLAPRTLLMTGALKLSGARYPRGSHLAYAGGWLWADGAGELLRVSPSMLALTGVVPLHGAYWSNVGASPDGTVLVVSEQGSTGAVQRRDPHTGALIASHPVGGAEAAVIDGFAGSDVWITVITGMSAYAERLSIATMAPRATRPIFAPSDLNLRVADGRVWVTVDEAGGTAGNYCADASTGRRLATLPVTSQAQGSLLAVGAGVLYYAEPGRHGQRARIALVPIPAACA
jgi:hypothetical protein